MEHVGVQSGQPSEVLTYIQKNCLSQLRRWREGMGNVWGCEDKTPASSGPKVRGEREAIQISLLGSREEDVGLRVCLLVQHFRPKWHVQASTGWMTPEFGANVYCHWGHPLTFTLGHRLIKFTTYLTLYVKKRFPFVTTAISFCPSLLSLIICKLIAEF